MRTRWPRAAASCRCRDPFKNPPHVRYREPPTLVPSRSFPPCYRAAAAAPTPAAPCLSPPPLLPPLLPIVPGPCLPPSLLVSHCYSPSPALAPRCAVPITMVISYLLLAVDEVGAGRPSPHAPRAARTKPQTPRMRARAAARRHSTGYYIPDNQMSTGATFCLAGWRRSFHPPKPQPAWPPNPSSLAPLAPNPQLVWPLHDSTLAIPPTS